MSSRSLPRARGRSTTRLLFRRRRRRNALRARHTLMAPHEWPILHLPITRTLTPRNPSRSRRHRSRRTRWCRRTQPPPRRMILLLLLLLLLFLSLRPSPGTNSKRRSTRRNRSPRLRRRRHRRRTRSRSLQTRRQRINLPLQLSHPTIRLLLAFTGRRGDNTRTTRLRASLAGAVGVAEVRFAADFEVPASFAGAGAFEVAVGVVGGICWVGGGL